MHDNVEAMTKFHGGFTKEHLAVVTSDLKSLLRRTKPVRKQP